MELIAIAIAIVAVFFLFVPASMLPLVIAAALGSDTIDGADRRRFAETVLEPAWSDADQLAA